MGAMKRVVLGRKIKTAYHVVMVRKERLSKLLVEGGCCGWLVPWVWVGVGWCRVVR